MRTQERWIKKYLCGGVQELLTDAPNLKKSKIITATIHQGLSESVHSSDTILTIKYSVKSIIARIF